MSSTTASLISPVENRLSTTSTKPRATDANDQSAEHESDEDYYGESDEELDEVSDDENEGMLTGLDALRKINESLTWDCMVEGEPYDELPLGYAPEELFDHLPPIFDYGIILDLPEIEEYADKNNFLKKAKGTLTANEAFGLTGQVVSHLEKRIGLLEYDYMDFGIPMSKSGYQHICFSILNTYGNRVPDSKRDDIVQKLEDATGKKVQWWISGKNRDFVLHDSYAISEEKYTAVFGSPA